MYDVVLYAFNPFRGKLCINKDILIFAPAGPLIRFFLKECDALPHSDKEKNGKECQEIKFYVDIVIFAFTVMTL
jgi:hypothetical protein